MYLTLGILIMVATVLVALFFVGTVVYSAVVEKELISKKSLVFIAPAFVLAYMLYITASFYVVNVKNKEMMLDYLYFFSLIYTTFDIFKFKAPNDLLAPIVQEYEIYYADFILITIVSAASVIIGFGSFFSQRIRNFFSKIIRFCSNCDIVIGDSEDSLKYLKRNKNSVMLGVNISRKRYGELLKEGVTVTRMPLSSKILATLLIRGEHHLIVFRDVDLSYSSLIETFSGIKNGKKSLVYLHLESDIEEMKIIKEKFIATVKEDTNSFVSCFNKHELIARHFVFDYPISKYIPRTFYNNNFTLKSEKDIHVVFLGFGKVNYQLFKLTAMQFQFAEEVGGKLVSKPVHYHVFDYEDKQLSNEFFSRILYEFDETFKNTDFPKPEKICDFTNEEIHALDIDSVEARKKFRSFVTENSFTYFIISLASDLEDASCAQTIKRMLVDESNYRIFVRAKNNNSETLNCDNDDVIYFGDDDKIYSHSCVVNDDLSNLSQRINLIYNVKSAAHHIDEIKTEPLDERFDKLCAKLKIPELRKMMIIAWEKLPLVEQYSNIYSALNLPFKLGIMGFSMEKKGSKKTKVSEDQFNERYINPARVAKYKDYKCYFEKYSSNVLAFIEHSRWNAYYIMSDYTQMRAADFYWATEEEAVKKLMHKNTDLKQHACITSYEGVDKVVRLRYAMLYPDADKNPASTDKNLCTEAYLYNNDFQNLDECYASLAVLGYVVTDNTKAKIIK